MIYVYVGLVLVVMMIVYDTGKANAKKEWRGTPVRQNEAMDGVYKVLVIKKVGQDVVAFASRHDGQLTGLILESDPGVNIFKIKDGHVIPFD